MKKFLFNKFYSFFLLAYLCLPAIFNETKKKYGLFIFVRYQGSP